MAEVRLGKSGLVALHGRLRHVFLHNLIMGAIGVDHINHDGLDNRRENLRLVTNAQNARNSRPSVSGRSAFKGVHWHKKNRTWAAAVGGTGDRQHLGYFKVEEDAARAYDLAALARYGEHAYLNFPRETT